jgi:plasmid stabilization system protein ParE
VIGVLRIRYTKAAKSDLADIARYLHARIGKNGTRAWLKRIRQRAQSLRHDGLSYREREELNPGQRAVNVGPWMIFYRVEGDTLFVQRILRGTRQITPDLLDEG